MLHWCSSTDLPSPFYVRDSLNSGFTVGYKIHFECMISSQQRTSHLEKIHHNHQRMYSLPLHVLHSGNKHYTRLFNKDTCEKWKVLMKFFKSHRQKFLLISKHLHPYTVRSKNNFAKKTIFDKHTMNREFSQWCSHLLHRIWWLQVSDPIAPSLIQHELCLCIWKRVHHSLA